ncbi:MAG: acyl-CoA dehydrogenase family protein, partial [Actinomycetota bacterium]|nr:acyl-CoA dehydrogenase family protein [Actinomycetota bacterium]
MLVTPEHDAFRTMVRNYVEREINPHIPKWEEAEIMPLHEVFADMAKLGMIGLEYEAEYGGQDASHMFTVILGEEVGRCDNGSFPMALGVQVDMATPSLARYGTAEQKERYLGPALRGEMVAAIAVSEPDHG